MKFRNYVHSVKLNKVLNQPIILLYKKDNFVICARYVTNMITSYSYFKTCHVYLPLFTNLNLDHKFGSNFCYIKHLFYNIYKSISNSATSSEVKRFTHNVAHPSHIYTDSVTNSINQIIHKYKHFQIMTLYQLTQMESDFNSHGTNFEQLNSVSLNKNVLHLGIILLLKKGNFFVCAVPRGNHFVDESFSLPLDSNISNLSKLSNYDHDKQEYIFNKWIIDHIGITHSVFSNFYDGWQKHAKYMSLLQDTYHRFKLISVAQLVKLPFSYSFNKSMDVTNGKHVYSSHLSKYNSKPFVCSGYHIPTSDIPVRTLRSMIAFALDDLRCMLRSQKRFSCTPVIQAHLSDIQLVLKNCNSQHKSIQEMKSIINHALTLCNSTHIDLHAILCGVRAHLRDVDLVLKNIQSKTQNK